MMNSECKFFSKSIFIVLPLLGFSACEEKIFSSTAGHSQNWPKYNSFGQISAVSTDRFGNIFVFHRGNQQWNPHSFSSNNVFTEVRKGPIPNDTIVVLDPGDGSLIKKTGNHLFYMPHGLTIDDENNIWVTDVALHQVFKFPPLNLLNQSDVLSNPILTLGVKFKPGNDEEHFCKPTDIIVDKYTKDFYVSDGYCNARIIKYDKFGKKLLMWGRSSPIGIPLNYFLNVPHSLALSQEDNILYVADRENFRVVSYTQDGYFKLSFASDMQSRIFSVAYSDIEGGLLFTLTNSSIVPKTVSVYKSDTGEYLISFSPDNNFTNPHDLTISPDGKYCYVVELNPHKIWKFKIDLPRISEIIQHSTKHSPQRISLKPTTPESNDSVPAENLVEAKKPAELSHSILATGLVISIVVVSFLIFMLHYYRRKVGYRKYESRRLIINDEEEPD